MERRHALWWCVCRCWVSLCTTSWPTLCLSPPTKPASTTRYRSSNWTLASQCAWAMTLLVSGPVSMYTALHTVDAAQDKLHVPRMLLAHHQPTKHPTLFSRCLRNHPGHLLCIGCCRVWPGICQQGPAAADPPPAVQGQQRCGACAGEQAVWLPLKHQQNVAMQAGGQWQLRDSEACC